MSDRLLTKKENDIIAVDVVDDQLVLKRYDGSTLTYTDGEAELPPQAPIFTSIDPVTTTQSAPTYFTCQGDLFPMDGRCRINLSKAGGFQMTMIPTVDSPQELRFTVDPPWNGGGGAWDVKIGARPMGPWSPSLPITVS